jgi:hypothetical protein
MRERAAWGIPFLASVALAQADPQVSVNPDIQYFYSEGRGENLNVSSNGRLVMVCSPIDISGGAETDFHSFIPYATHVPSPSDPFTSNAVLDLGLVEATDVAIFPNRKFGLVATRGNGGSVTTGNALLAVNKTAVLQTLEIAGRPDGMKVSPDEEYAIIAIEKGGTGETGGKILIYDLAGGPGQIALVGVVTREMLEAMYPAGAPNPVGAAI